MKLERFKLLLVCLFIAPLLLAVKPTPDDFRHHIEIHRQQVVQNGLHLADKFYGQLPLISQLPREARGYLLEYYLEMHDLPKTMSLQELRAFGYKGSISIRDELYAIYGQDVQGSKPAFIDELNRIEENYKLVKMKDILPAMNQHDFDLLMRDLKWIEFISDITDTKISRSTELGFKPRKMAARKFFMNLRDLKAARAAMWLENTYYSNRLNCQKLF